jgi:hypothetical protein
MLERVSRSRVVPGTVGAMMDTSGEIAAAGAMARAGEVVSGLGSMLGEIAQRKQAALNQKELSKRSRMFNESANDLKVKLSQEGDRSKFPAIWEKHKSELTKSLKGGEYSPDVHDQIQEMQAEHESRMRILVKTEEARRVADETIAEGNAAIESHIENDNAEAAIEEVHGMRGSGVISAEQARKLEKSILPRIQRRQIEKAISADPAKALRDLEERTEGGAYKNWKGLDDQDRRTMKAHARNERNVKGTQFYSEFLTMVAEEDMSAEVRDEFYRDVVKPMVAKGELTEGQGLSLYNSLYSTQTLPNWKNVPKIMEMAEALPVGADPKSDEVLAVYKAAAIGNLPQSQVSIIHDMIRSRVKGVSRSGRIGAHVEKELDGYLRKQIETHHPDLMETDREEVAKRSEAIIAYKQQFDEWAKDNPKATFRDGQKFIHGMFVERAAQMFIEKLSQFGRFGYGFGVLKSAPEEAKEEKKVDSNALDALNQMPAYPIF